MRMKPMLASAVVEIPLDSITVSKSNTRTLYNEEKMQGLTESVSLVGQIYPVVVRRLGTRNEKFELIIGTRRLKAAHRRKSPTIPAFVVDSDRLDDTEVTLLALAENLHRDDLTPFEEARAMLKLCKEHDMTPKQVSRRIGKPLPYVQSRLKLLSVPDQVQNMLCSGGVTLSHVGVLASLKRPRDQIRYARIVAKQSLSEQDLVTLLEGDAEQVGRQKERPASRQLFTPQRTALKVKRFQMYLNQKVRPRMELGGQETQEIRTALRQVRKTINELLGRRKLKQVA